MKAIRTDEYHKYGCNFYGKLVVVDYTEEVKSILCTAHNFDRGLPELEQAKN